MNKTNFLYIVSIFVLTSCSSLKNIGISSYNKTNSHTSIEKKTVIVTKEPALKFIENISLKLQSTITKPVEVKKETTQHSNILLASNPVQNIISIPEIERASFMQIKYSILLGIEIEEVTNLKLIEYIDEWMGTRYCMGGSTKNCIDCSAFTQIFFTTMYGLSLPRTAREQYNFSDKISRTEMQEGDLLFFNTKGGISHVGIYLQNNKFVHAGSSEGVTISDVFEPYWVKRFIGVGRIARETTKP